MASEKKVTPAMRAWCRWLLDPKMRQLRRVGTLRFIYSTVGILASGKPNYIMVDKLENAGLITWDRIIGTKEFVAVLTEAGKAAGNGNR